MSKQNSSNREISRILIPSIFFAFGIFFAFFLTHKDVLNENNWKTLVIIRIIWQLGGAIWTGIAILTFFSTTKRKLINIFVFFVLGIALSFNALVDLFRGPIQLSGSVENILEDTTFIPSSGYSMGSDQKINILYFKDSNGNKYEFEINTDFGLEMKKKIKSCDTKKVKIIYLTNLDGILNIECEI